MHLLESQRRTRVLRHAVMDLKNTPQTEKVSDFQTEVDEKKNLPRVPEGFAQRKRRKDISLKGGPTDRGPYQFRYLFPFVRHMRQKQLCYGRRWVGFGKSENL